MKEIDESCRDAFRSKVSSPGMPKTYLTPSASRHSTNRSDALRSVIATTSIAPRCPATLGPSLALGMARLFTLTLLACLLAAAPASAASRFTIRGAGFGHGVGMSQYGALGFAQHG